MDIQDYIENLKLVQNNILQIIESDDDDIEELFENLKDKFDNFRLDENHLDLKTILYLISNISNNHSRTPSFFNKIEQILLMIKKPMMLHFTDFDIFQIFIYNKRLLLFLIENQIIKITRRMIDIFFDDKYEVKKYPQYFIPEIKEFIDKKLFEKLEKENYDENYDQKRKIGENDNYIAELIRKDQIEDFITFIIKSFYSIDSKIDISIFETNPDLLNGKVSLIEYAAFFGSIQIFKYLKLNGADLNKSIWLFSVKGENQEIMEILKDHFNNEIPYRQCMNESIKCHHNHIVNYIQNNFKIEDNDDEESKKYENDFKYSQLSYIFRYYNFSYFPSNFDDKFTFFYLCKYDYVKLVDYLLKTNNIDVNLESPTKDTAIHLAGKKNNIEIVNLLLSQKEIKLIDNCFYNCSRIEKISIPSYITSIGNNAFKGCTFLTNLSIPSTVTKIGSCCFEECSLLTEILLPPSITTIEMYTFNGCKSLKTIKIPPTVTSIGKGAFKRCSSLTKVEIPQSISSIENYLFEDCFSLVEVVLPSSLKEINKSVFNGCKSLKEINIPSSVTLIGKNCFEGCSSLTNVSIPLSVNQINGCTFNGCSSLKEITIPNGVTKIDSSAFEDCSALESITIPSSVSVIGSSAFQNCTSLSKVVFEMPTSIDQINRYTFMKCYSLTDISIPPTVISIKSNAFECCSSLSHVEIPSSVKTIFKSAFLKCISLPPNSIPESLLKEDPKSPCYLI